MPCPTEFCNAKLWKSKHPGPSPASKPFTYTVGFKNPCWNSEPHIIISISLLYKKIPFFKWERKFMGVASWESYRMTLIPDVYFVILQFCQIAYLFCWNEYFLLCLEGKSQMTCTVFLMVHMWNKSLNICLNFASFHFSPTQCCHHS